MRGSFRDFLIGGIYRNDLFTRQEIIDLLKVLSLLVRLFLFFGR
jgi:hypothetical protein